MKVYDTQIPIAVKAAEVSAMGKSIYSYDAGSSVAKAYEKLTKEVLYGSEKRENAFDLPKLDEYFTTQEQRDDAKLKKIYEIPLEEIDEFPDHPFKVLDDEDMMNLAESIREQGIITPATLRKKEDGRYEILSGHRRKEHASLRAWTHCARKSWRWTVMQLSYSWWTVICSERRYCPAKKHFHTR